MGAVKGIVCLFNGHDPDPNSVLFHRTEFTMCRRCDAVIRRPAATPKGGAK